jgi:hypothetical protein
MGVSPGEDMQSGPLTYVHFFCGEEEQPMARRLTVYCPLKLSPAMKEEVARWAQTFGKSQSQIIRALIAGAKPESFPTSWQVPDDEKALLATIEGR